MDLLRINPLYRRARTSGIPFLESVLIGYTPALFASLPVLYSLHTVYPSTPYESSVRVGYGLLGGMVCAGAGLVVGGTLAAVRGSLEQRLNSRQRPKEEHALH